MSQVQDVFGTAPKTVLNKPMMHVQEQHPVETNLNTVVGDNVRQLNTVLINEIGGASLVGNEISLPAGEYYFEGLACAGNGTASNATIEYRTEIQLSDGTVLILGPSYAPTRINSHGVGTVGGKIVLSAPATIRLSSRSNIANTAGLSAPIGVAPEVYSDLRIWKLDSDIESPVISDPTLTLARPLFHAAYPVSTTYTMDAATRTAVLDTVLTNEIAGASLAANEVTLPAGEYYVEGQGLARTTETNCGTVTVKKSDDTVLLNGNATGSPEEAVWVSGRITLTEQTTIKLVVQQLHTGGTIALGNLATPTNVNELKIWQLDAVNKQPVIVNDKLFPLPGNVMVTGNMHGLEYEYVDANNIKVYPGICMDSTNENALSLALETTVPITVLADTVFNLFLTDDATTPIKIDTDVDGINLPAQDKRRWIGYVLNDSSGNVLKFDQSGNHIYFTTDLTVLEGAGDTAQLVDASAFVPVSRVARTMFGARYKYTSITTNLFRLYHDSEGTNGATLVGGPLQNAYTYVSAWFVGHICWARSAVGTDNRTYLRAVEMKR